ncbi:MAG: hypothetical protein JNM84_23770 [Planctomycetes bacterium]|nr:hypothetical protein [Planctomycetota bacterium]
MPDVELWSRRGKVFPERYHDEVITTPTQARNALRYVLQNGKNHGVVAQSSIDPCSSAPTFDGWMERPSIQSIPSAPVVASVAPASTWLLTTGWRRLGLLGIHELPISKHAGRPQANVAESRRRATSRGTAPHCRCAGVDPPVHRRRSRVDVRSFP